MPKLYEYGQAKEIRHNKRWMLFLAVMAVIIFAIWLFLYLDTDRSKSIDDSDNKPITSEFVLDNEPKKLIDEPTYTIEVPESWRQTDRYLDNGRLFVEYKGPEGSVDSGRTIEVYSGGLPRDPSATRLLEIVPREDGTIRIKESSERCHTFTDSAQAVATPEPELAKWNQVEFSCNFSTIMNTIGTGSVDYGQATVVNGETTSSTYFFRYSDQNTTTDFEVFKEVVSSFKAK